MSGKASSSEMRNSSNSQSAKPFQRQHTTSWISGIGPLSAIRMSGVTGAGGILSVSDGGTSVDGLGACSLGRHYAVKPKDHAPEFSAEAIPNHVRSLAAMK